MLKKPIEIDLFVPCFVDQAYPTSAMNAVKVLEYYGCNVNYNPNQTCCGQPAYNAGFWNDAREVAEKFMKEFSNEQRYIVVISSSCTGMIRNYYEDLFKNTSFHNQWKNLRKMTFEFCEFLVKVLKVDTSELEYTASITYHDACSALRECFVYEEPRQLLKNVKGIEFRELKENRTCCGFGGTFAVKYEPISVGMAEQKVFNAMETGAECLVSADLSCLLHMDAYIRNKEFGMKALHVADILAEGIRK